MTSRTSAPDGYTLSMNDTPLARLDPTRLREEGHDIDLGDDTGFDHVKNDDSDEAQRDRAIDEAIAGVSPPAR